MNGNQGSIEDRVIQILARRLLKAPDVIRRDYELDYFSYSHEFLPKAASNEETTNFLVQNDSGFVIVKTMGTVASNVNVFVTNISDTPKYTPFTLIWTDSGSGRDLMDRRVSYGNVIGTGERPYYWPKPKLLDPNSTFTIRLNNLVATAFNVRITYSGFKVFGDVEAFKARH